MAGFLYKGILLSQYKEPALSRGLREFFNAETIGVAMDREPVARPDELTHDDLLSISRQARIVDERDGKLLADKLAASRRKKPRVLVADAIDDEPYISSQLGPLLENERLTADGLRFAQRVSGSKEAFFAVYKNLSEVEVKIPRRIDGFEVRRIHGRYPAEYQASRIFSANASTLLLGAGALLHLARAVYFNKPQSTTFLTVAGDCVANPANLEVSLGMTIAQVLERCGLIADPARVVIGGSMTGISLIDTERTLVTPTTRAILAFRGKTEDLHFQCIGCSRCVHACPEGLNPYYLYRSVKLRRYDDFRRLDAQMCIGCGTCSYMCPAKLDLSETIRDGAREFRRMTGSMRAAAVKQARAEQAQFEEYMEDHRARRAEAAARAARRRDALAERLATLREKLKRPAPETPPEALDPPNPPQATPEPAPTPEARPEPAAVAAAVAVSASIESAPAEVMPVGLPIEVLSAEEPPAASAAPEAVEALPIEAEGVGAGPEGSFGTSVFEEPAFGTAFDNAIDAAAPEEPAFGTAFGDAIDAEALEEPSAEPAEARESLLERFDGAAAELFEEPAREVGLDESTAQPPVNGLTQSEGAPPVAENAGDVLRGWRRNEQENKGEDD